MLESFAVLALLCGAPSASAYRGDVDILRQDLENGAWNERLRAANQLGALPDKEAGEALALALRDPDWQVRFAAAHWLGRRGEVSTHLMEKRLSLEACPVVRMTLAHWLASKGMEPPEAERKGDRVEGCESWFWPVSAEFLRGRGRSSRTEVATPPDEKGCVYVRFRRAGRTSCPAGTMVKGVGRSPGHVDFLREETPMSGVALCCPPGKETGGAEAPTPQDAECRLVPMECPTGWLEMQPEEEGGVFSRKDPRYERTKRMKEGDLPWVNCCRAQEVPKPETPPARPAWSEPTTGSRIAGLAFLTDGAEENDEEDDEFSEPPPEPARGGRARPAPVKPSAHETRVVRSRNQEAGPAPGSSKLPTPVPLDALLASLRSGDPEERSRSALSLGSLGSGADPAVSPLISALKDGNPGVRACAAMALGNITRGSDRAVAFIRRLLEDEHSGVRYGAAQALGRIGTPSAQKAFSNAMRQDAEKLIKSGQ